MIHNGTEPHSSPIIASCDLCDEVTGCIYSFQLGGQSNGCATHTDRHNMRGSWTGYIILRKLIIIKIYSQYKAVTTPQKLKITHLFQSLQSQTPWNSFYQLSPKAINHPI